MFSNECGKFMKNYKQTTYETCLACCLFQQTNKNVTRKKELECINHSMKLCKDDFVFGHLDYFNKNYNLKFRRIIDNVYFYNWLKRKQLIRNNLVRINKINLMLINHLLNTGERPILYVDAYYLFSLIHYPHFITIVAKLKNKYKIFDTWDGKEKIIDAKTLSRSIQSLRNHLKFCPQILIIFRDK
jgi:hypothetical protein